MGGNDSMRYHITHTDPRSESFLTCNREFLAHTQNRWDLAVDDPPYFSGPEKRKFYGGQKSSTGVKRCEYPVTQNWEIPDKSYFKLLESKTKNQIIWGANYFDFGIYEPHKTPRKGKEFDQWLRNHPTGWIAWDKVNGASSYNDYELAWTSFDRPTIVFPYMWNGMCQGKSISEGYIMRGNKKLNEKRIHTTQKPIDLYRFIFMEYMETGQWILDPHSGSQSSRIAAFDYGVHYTGLEIEEVYFDKGNHRSEQYIYAKQTQLSFL
jgi:site-specific DNA-methyltransferase (adenine-specific)